jgi:hypothetical protein
MIWCHQGRFNSFIKIVTESLLFTSHEAGRRRIMELKPRVPTCYGWTIRDRPVHTPFHVTGCQCVGLNIHTQIPYRIRIGIENSWGGNKSVKRKMLWSQSLESSRAEQRSTTLMKWQFEHRQSLSLENSTTGRGLFTYSQLVSTMNQESVSFRGLMLSLAFYLSCAATLLFVFRTMKSYVVYWFAEPSTRQSILCKFKHHRTWCPNIGAGPSAASLREKLNTCSSFKPLSGPSPVDNLALLGIPRRVYSTR